MTARPAPLVCAHRGASLELADNSLEAFAAAIASGCDVIETDVRLRADGTLVLAHDPEDVVEGVAELGALLELADGRIGLDLEIVQTGLERALVDAVDGFDGWLLVTSIWPEVLEGVARLTRHIDTGLVIEAPYTGDPFAAARECGANVTLVEDELATPELLQQARRSGRPFWVWTVNDAERLDELLATRGVTGVITDDPALAVHRRAALGAQAPAGTPAAAATCLRPDATASA